MRIMALDYGDKNIGVAISDELKLIAYGLEVIKRKSPDKFYFEIQRLNDIIIEYKINKIIIGLPKNLDNTLGYQCEKTLVFKKKLDEAFKNLDIILWDERLSTAAATKNLSSIGLNTRKQKKIIDKMAAVFILQGYLDHLKFKEDINNNMIFDDDNFDDDDNDKDNVIMMFDEDGNEQEFYVLGSVDYENEKYLIVSEDLELDEENEEQDVIVLKEVPHNSSSNPRSENKKNKDGNEEEKIDYQIVDDDDLLDTIISLFEDQLGDEE